MIKYFLSKNITKEQTIDTGMAMVLILLIINVFSKNDIYLKIAIPVLIVNMIFPKVYYPLAVFWFGLSHFLGTIISKILLSIIYFVILTPVGLIRRILGYDSLKLNQFKKSRTSVFVNRNTVFNYQDIEKPY